MWVITKQFCRLGNPKKQSIPYQLPTEQATVSHYQHLGIEDNRISVIHINVSGVNQ